MDIKDQTLGSQDSQFLEVNKSLQSTVKQKQPQKKLEKVVTFQDKSNKEIILDTGKSSPEGDRGKDSLTVDPFQRASSVAKDMMNDSVVSAQQKEEDLKSDDYKSSYDADSVEEKEDGSSDDENMSQGTRKGKRDLETGVQRNDEQMIIIPSLEEDVKYLKDFQPVEYYLKQCLIYAQTNLMQIEKPILPYTFSYEDIRDNIFVGTTFTLDASIQNLRKMYKPADKKFYNDIIFIKGQQQMIIKTWEAFEPQESILTMSPIIKKKKEDASFTVKTLRLYDSNNDVLTEIMTEQIVGEFHQNLFYEASTIVYDDCIYYFKRHCEDHQTTYLRNNLIRRMTGEDTCMTSLRDSKKNEDQSDINYDNPQFYHIYLQLYKYDFTALKESKVDGYQISHVEGNTDKDRNYNYMFSKEFGLKIEPKYDNEEMFLSNQYLILQEYIMKENGCKNILFYNLGDLSKPIHVQHVKETSDENEETQMIQQLYHLFVKSETDAERSKDEKNNQNNDKNLFITITEKNHIHYSYIQEEVTDKETNEVKNKKWMDNNIKIYRQEYAFKKTANPLIHVQKFQIEDFSIKGKKRYKDQYFFVDFRNRVTLMYPNYDLKSDRFLNIDQICNLGDILQLDYKDYKKIDCIEDTCFNKVCMSNNILQNIKHLKKAINYNQINLNHVLTFCNDKINQVLYITCQQLQRVDIVFMKDHHSEQTETAADFSKEDLLIQRQGDPSIQAAQQYNQIIENAKAQRQKQSKKFMTYKIFKKNSIQKHLGETVFSALKNEEQTADVITFDINTQKIKLAQKSNDQDSQNQPLVTKKTIKDMVTGLDKVLDLNKKKRPCKLTFFDEMNEERTLQCCYISKSTFIQIEPVYTHSNNGESFVFVVKVASQIRDIINRSFFFIQKTKQEVDVLISEYLKKPERVRKNLVEVEDRVLMLNNDYELEEKTLLEIHNMHREGTNLSIQKLTFEKFVNNKGQSLNFIPIIYQEMRTSDKNTMLIYDVKSNKILQKIPINPSSNNLKYLYIDDEGFSPFKICRSQNLVEKPVIAHNHLLGNKELYKVQQIRLQIYIIFIEKLGRIQVQDFVISQNGNNQEITVNQVGMKNLLFSRRCIETCNWSFVRNSYAIPFVDEVDGNILGCQFVLKHDEKDVDMDQKSLIEAQRGDPTQTRRPQLKKTRQSLVNLIDDRYNNLYTYESQILRIGKKKFLLDENDSQNYLYVISARVRDDIIQYNLFDQSETNTILRGAIEIILRMRKPSLDYMLMNTFESLRKNDFFSSQEILKGQSICDICLSDTGAIKYALKYYDAEKEDIKDSIVQELAKGDFLRMNAFKDIGFYPKNLVITHDFNFIGTISRGLKMNSMRSVKMIMEYILEDLATMDYYNLMMLELPQLLSTQQIDVKNFFKQEEDDEVEKLEEGEEENTDENKLPLGIEKTLQDDRLITFTPNKMKYLNQLKFENIHQKEIEQEMIELLIKRDREDMLQDVQGQDDNSQYYEILHTYIDFKYMIIGEKIRHIDQPEQMKSLKFNDEYFSNMIIEQESFLKFFNQVSVNKFIDYQFETARIFMQGLFWFYVTLFLLPYMITLVSNDVTVHRTVFNVCILPQLALLTIELLQFKEQGRKYFEGWNLIDMTQIMLFLTLYYKIVIQADQDFPFLPFMKLGMILLSSIKCIHFVASFSEFGFFITMVIISILDLVPFLMSYIGFAFFFASLYSAIEAEIDEELNSGVGLGKFGRLFLMVWRNSVGKLSFVRYSYWTNNKTGIELTLGVEFVYLVYYVQITIMLVVMLNFMIAIIDQTYKKVISQKKIHIYKNKAELNQESYQILKYFPCFIKLKEYKVIVFSTCKDYEETLDKKIGVDDDDLENFIDELMEQAGKENNKRQKKLIESNEIMENIMTRQREFIRKIDKEYQDYTNDLQNKKNEFISQLINLTNGRGRDSVSVDNMSVRSQSNTLKKRRQVNNAAVNSSRIVSSRISEQADDDDDIIFPIENQNGRNDRAKPEQVHARVSSEASPGTKNKLNVREEQKSGGKKAPQVQSTDLEYQANNQTKFSRTTQPNNYSSQQQQSRDQQRGVRRGGPEEMKRKEGQGYYTFRNDQQ